MSQKNEDMQEDNFKPKTRVEAEAEEFEENYEHSRGGKKKFNEVPSHQSKPKSVR